MNISASCFDSRPISGILHLSATRLQEVQFTSHLKQGPSVLCVIFQKKSENSRLLCIAYTDILVIPACIWNMAYIQNLASISISYLYSGHGIYSDIQTIRRCHLVNIMCVSSNLNISSVKILCYIW